MSPSTKDEDRSRLDGVELEIFKLVRKGATSKQWTEWLRVPLEHAAADGNMDLFARLTDAGASVIAGWRGCHGRTLLGAAAAGKSEKIVRALLNAGATSELYAEFGEDQQSALHVAATHGAEAVLRAPMLAGADPNVLDLSTQTPLHLAAQEGHDVIVSDFLERGACPNVDNRGMRETPLHLAAKKGRVSCVSKLLLGGADKDSRNEFGETPLYLAARDNQVGAVEELLAAHADDDIRACNDRRPLDIASMLGHLGVLRALLRHGGDTKAYDDYGYTVLHRTVDCCGEPGRDNGGAVRVLLEAGADIEVKTANNWETALHVATVHRYSSRRTMEALLEGGPNVNARNIEESTPLHYACCYTNVDCVELLLRWGADETLVSDNGMTAAESVGLGDAYGDEEQRRADDQRIRHMLARAPADRSWRRRGWLVLARSHPARVQLANDNSRSSNDGSSAEVAKVGCDGLDGDDGGDGGQAKMELGSLVGRVVDLHAEGVFRLVIGFL